MNTVLLNFLGEDICKQIEIWTTTPQNTLKLYHQIGAITGLWTCKPITTTFIGMPRTTKNELKNIQEEFDTAVKARKKFLAEHMWMTWDRYVRRENLGREV